MGFEIPIDSAYSGHPKTLHLIALTGKPEADAYPIRLWMWAAEYAKDGVVGGGPPQVELACRWRGTPGKLAKALVKAGFMEVDGKTIHDWMEHVGRAIAIYEEKKRIQREKYAASKGINPAVFRKNSTYPSNPSNPSVESAGAPRTLAEELPVAGTAEPVKPSKTLPGMTWASLLVSHWNDQPRRAPISTDKGVRHIETAHAAGLPKEAIQRAIWDQALCDGKKLFEVLDGLIEAKKSKEDAPDAGYTIDRRI